jgi:hypothetical protein
VGDRRAQPALSPHVFELGREQPSGRREDQHSLRTSLLGLDDCHVARSTTCVTPSTRRLPVNSSRHRRRHRRRRHKISRGNAGWEAEPALQGSAATDIARARPAVSHASRARTDRAPTAVVERPFRFNAQALVAAVTRRDGRRGGGLRRAAAGEAAAGIDGAVWSIATCPAAGGHLATGSTGGHALPVGLARGPLAHSARGARRRARRRGRGLAVDGGRTLVLAGSTRLRSWDSPLYGSPFAAANGREQLYLRAASRARARLHVGAAAADDPVGAPQPVHADSCGRHAHRRRLHRPSDLRRWTSAITFRAESGRSRLIYVLLKGQKWH